MRETVTQEAAPIAAVGLGRMGGALATALSRTGFTVHGWNRTHHRAAELASGSLHAVKSLRAAVAAARIIVVCLPSYQQARELLQETDLEGRIMVNLTTGTTAEAIETASWATERGCGYLDGAILCYPENIGTENGSVMVSGPADLWPKVAPLVEAWGPAGEHLGQGVELANVVDAALVGAFHIPSLVAFVEAAGYALDSGLQADQFRAMISRALVRFVDRTDAVVQHILTNDFHSNQAAVYSYAAGARGFLETMTEHGRDAHMLGAAAELLTAAEEHGLGGSAISSLYQLRVTTEEDRDRATCS